MCTLRFLLFQYLSEAVTLGGGGTLLLSTIGWYDREFFGGWSFVVGGTMIINGR